MKTKILIAAVMFFALSVSAFAQQEGVSFTTGSEQPIVACCGLAERLGDIQFSAVLQPVLSISVTGTINVHYTVPITNDELTGITVTSEPAGIATIADVYADSDGTGNVSIRVAAGYPAPFAITLSGVRANVSGSCGPNPVRAFVTVQGNQITAGEQDVSVAAEVRQAFRTATGTPVTIDAGTGDPTPTTGIATFSVQENFLTALWNTEDQTRSKLVQLKLTGTLPPGVSFVFPPNDNSGLFTLANADGSTPAATNTVSSVPAGGAFVYYVVTTNTDPSILETFALDIQTENVGPYPLRPGTVSITAALGPITNTAGDFPRYMDGCATNAVPILIVAGFKTTTLMIPYAVDFGGVDYQTGIAIANTTDDPGEAVMGFGEAIPQKGKITFYFYPQDGAPFSWSTTEDPTIGEGLDEDGFLPSGGLYTVLLWQLLDQEFFSGYIIIVTDFTNAHGEYFISDWEKFTHGALMLVLYQDRTAPESLGN